MSNIGVLIYTYNRVDDAKINMEIIRNVWAKNKSLKDVKIVHSYNGNKQWYPKKTLEDHLVVTKNTWHFQGASDLIDAGMKDFSKDKKIDYVIVLASDTWLINPEYVEGLLNKMQKESLVLATCSWGLPERNEIGDVGVSMDFFIVDLNWARKSKMFPIDFKEFHDRYEDLFLYQKGGNVMLEKLFLARYLKAMNRAEGGAGSFRKKAFMKTLRIKEREPVHVKIDEKGNWIRTMYWPKMGLLTHHDPSPKKKILKKVNITNGKEIKRLLTAKDLSYYNQGQTTLEGNAN